MKEALNLIHSNKIYIKIFKEIDNKYKKYGKITGSFNIKAKNEDEKLVLSNFDSNVMFDNNAKIKCKTVEELFNRKLKNFTFLELLECVIGEELKTNKEINDYEGNKKKNFFYDVITGAEEGCGKYWFEFAVMNKTYGYNQVIRKYNELNLKNSLKNFKKDLIMVINSINCLPYIKGTFENIAVFAAKHTKNPHFFDYNTYNGNLFFHGIEYILKKENKNGDYDINEKNEMYYKVGILKDEISNHSTIYGFEAFDNFKNEIKAISDYSNWNEPLQISLSNLLRIDSLKVKKDMVFIFENPSVFHEVLKNVKKDVSLICTSGQLNLSSYMILDKIINLKTIYYAGDFDPEGLQIAYKIKLKYKEKVKFLLYDKEHYLKIKGENDIDDKRLKMLNSISCCDLNEIITEISKEKKAAYQELLIDEYIDEITNINF